MALLLSLLLLPFATLPAASRALAAEEEGELAVEITDVRPAFLRPGESLTVTGTVTNNTDEEITATALSLRLQRNAPGTRSAMDQWFNPEITFSTIRLARRDLGTPLPAGSSRAFSLTVAAEEFPLADTPSAWGPRGIGVDVIATSAAGAVTASVRTLLVWYPESTAQPTVVSVLVPLAPTASELISAQLSGTSLAEHSGVRVAELARATAGEEAVAWGLDPALLGSPYAVDVSVPDVSQSPTVPSGAATTAATSPEVPATSPTQTTPRPTQTTSRPTPATPSPSPGPDDADEAGDSDEAPGADDPEPNDLVPLLRSLATGRAIIALPYADADDAAAVHAGAAAEGLYELAVETGRGLMDEAELVAIDEIAWPAASDPDAVTVAALAEQGAGAVILPAAALPLRRSLTYTPTGRGTVEVEGGDDPGSNREVAALLAEGSLSAALGGAAPTAAAGRPKLSPSARDLGARQYLLGLAAMITRERPSDSRHVLAVVPRAFAGDAAALADRIAALREAPWVDLAPLTELRRIPDPGFDRRPLRARVVHDSEAPAELLEQVLSLRADLDRFSQIAEDPALLVRDEQRHLLQIASAAWRTDPSGRVSFANAARTDAAALEAAVGVLSGGTVNLISDTGDLPVTVRNKLDQPITASLRLRPDGPSIVVPEPVEVVVPAGSEVPFPVRVNAVGSTDVTILAQLTDATGLPVGQSATLVVRVRADWENVGTAIIAAVIGVVLVLGLVRSIRRSRRRGDAVPISEDAAT